MDPRICPDNKYSALADFIHGETAAAASVTLAVVSATEGENVSLPCFPVFMGQSTGNTNTTTPSPTSLFSSATSQPRTGPVTIDFSC